MIEITGLLAHEIAADFREEFFSPSEGANKPFCRGRESAKGFFFFFLFGRKGEVIGLKGEFWQFIFKEFNSPTPIDFCNLDIGNDERDRIVSKEICGTEMEAGQFGERFCRRV